MEASVPRPAFGPTEAGARPRSGSDRRTEPRPDPAGRRRAGHRARLCADAEARPGSRSRPRATAGGGGRRARASLRRHRQRHRDARDERPRAAARGARARSRRPVRHHDRRARGRQRGAGDGVRRASLPHQAGRAGGAGRGGRARGAAAPDGEDQARGAGDVPPRGQAPRRSRRPGGAVRRGRSRRSGSPTSRSCRGRGAAMFAYEALVRNEEPTLRSPPDLFEAAERLGRLQELGRAVRDRVARTLDEQPMSALLFINLHAMELDDDSLISADAPLSRHAARVVLEVTERAPLEKIRDVTARVAQLRALGYRIAVDDLGAGYAGLTSFAHLEPEVVKVDMSLIRGIDRSPMKQKLLGSIVALCRDLGIEIIAEGVETVGRARRADRAWAATSARATCSRAPRSPGPRSSSRSVALPRADRRAGLVAPGRQALYALRRGRRADEGVSIRGRAPPAARARGHKCARVHGHSYKVEIAVARAGRSGHRLADRLRRHRRRVGRAARALRPPQPERGPRARELDLREHRHLCLAGAAAAASRSCRR